MRGAIFRTKNLFNEFARNCNATGATNLTGVGKRIKFLVVLPKIIYLPHQISLAHARQFLLTWSFLL
jgi:hypothetical protein